MTRKWSWRRAAGSIVLLLIALISWAETGQISSAWADTALFTLALGSLLVALRPNYGLAILIGGVMALGNTSGHPPGGWNWVFLGLFSSGALILLRRYPMFGWMLASFPVWAMADSVPWLMNVALGMVFIGLATNVILLMPGRRTIHGPPPLSHLAGGPLIAVPARTYGFRRARKLFWITATLALAGILTGGILWLSGNRVAGESLIAVCAIIGLSMCGSIALSNRMRYRIDAAGLHSRVVFREQTIPWNTVGELTLRFSMWPGMGLRFVFYVVRSSTREFAFPGTIAGGEELRDLIASATGIDWPPAGFTSSL